MPGARKTADPGPAAAPELAWPQQRGISRSLINFFMGLSNVTERYFVTGTDTEVGKTVASSALLQAARLLGKNTAGYKPVASGSEMTAEGLRNTDALALSVTAR
jgi:dethiobiotin synthetase